MADMTVINPEDSHAEVVESLREFELFVANL